MRKQENALTIMQTHNIIILNLQMQKGEMSMKRVGLAMDDDLHKELKLYAVNQGKTVTDIIVGLVRKELEIKKEQSR